MNVPLSDDDDVPDWLRGTDIATEQSDVVSSPQEDIPSPLFSEETSSSDIQSPVKGEASENG